MRKLLPIFILIVAFCGFALAQIMDRSCPTISVNGPSGMVSAGETAQFIVSIDTKGKSYDLKYIWSASAGEIVSGQGTTSVQVRVPEMENLTVMVEIKGLPDGCPDTFSETQGCRLRPEEAIKLEEFIGPLAKIAIERFTKILDVARSRPNAQLYIIIFGSQKNTAPSIKRKRDIIFDRIVRKFGEDSRVTFVNSDKNDDRVLVWLVPPGATPPNPTF